MLLGVVGMRRSPRMQVRVKKSKGRASLTARKVYLANWRAYHIMQSAGNLRRKRRERVEGEDERGEGRREEGGLAQNEKLLAANNEKKRHGKDRVREPPTVRIISIDFWGTS